jgi:hypothetical protein
MNGSYGVGKGSSTDSELGWMSQRIPAGKWTTTTTNEPAHTHIHTYTDLVAVWVVCEGLRGGGVEVVEERDALVGVDGDEHVRAQRVDGVRSEPPGVQVWFV